MIDRFKQIGGARVGRSSWFGLNATFPFAALEVTQEQISLWVIGIPYRFPHDTITRLSRYRGFFSSGLRIEHSMDGYAPFVVFWTFDFGALEQRLTELGYRVE